MFLGDELVALVEIDGETHYKQLSQQLRRKDKMKEFLYMTRYQMPLYRMRIDHINALGFKKSANALAQWIVRDLVKKGKIVRKK